MIEDEGLRLQVLSLQRIPMDEAPAEGTHRASHKECSRTPAGKLPWHFSSQRLQQNLEDFKTIPGDLEDPSLGEDCWASWKQVLQVTQKRARANNCVRMSRRAFLHKVYRIGEESMQDVSSMKSGVAEVEAGPDVAKLSGMGKLWDAYLQHALTPKTYITLPSTEAPGFTVYQVLAYGARKKNIRGTGVVKFLSPITLQRYECFQPPNIDQLLDSVLNVYSVGDLVWPRLFLLP
jgi:hypothetical protein